MQIRKCVNRLVPSFRSIEKSFPSVTQCKFLCDKILMPLIVAYRFISPLTPVTRKYLEVNKAPVDAPQPLKLSGPAFKQAPQSTTNMNFPERPPSSASI